MALDYFTWTGSPEYLPLAYSVADFWSQHFTNRSADGRVIVWPAQVLETYWCTYNPGTNQSAGWFSNCCEDDAPTVTGMHSLFERLLALPPALTTPQQRAAWAAFVAIMPLVPVANNTILPARVLSEGTHNSEGPELYAAHP